ncbi:MAG: zinc ribbon domain-containing protein [Clostridiales bacterium]|nr:zinc ribbon domain-containing protein [Clostridiales bacterium]
MVTIKCAKCGATIQLDETQPTQFCTNCGSPIVLKTANNRTAPIKNVEEDDFAKLAKQYESYVNQFDTNLHPVYELFRAFVELEDLWESANHSRSQLEWRASQVEDVRQEYNRRVITYNNAVYFDEKDERQAREAINSYDDEYNQKYRKAREVQKETIDKINTYNQKVREYEQLHEKLLNNELKSHSLAYQTAETMVERYPNNPISHLYMADIHRREVLWMQEICKKAIAYILDNYEDEYYAEDLYKYYMNKVQNDENYKSFNESYATASHMLGKTISAQYSALYNEIVYFSQHYSSLVYETKQAIKQIEEEQDKLWKKQRRAERLRKFKRNVIATAITLVVLAIAGAALYYFVLK